ncbi:MAG: succinyl-CoA synthetase subunit alpha [Anaerolineaceae bacterium]|nr:MAG: succinyl-CoA synthetase subunit alpha [Anaerolineaceae bacterium]
MIVRALVKPSEYHDSVSLMLVARELAGLEGIRDAAVMMATEANKSIMAEAGLLTDEAKSAAPNDLLIAVSAENESLADAALQMAEALLKKKASSAQAGEFKPKTIRGALASNSAANVAVISVAGRYAADEAWDALTRGLHVLLFSDNVSLEDEIALKKFARDHGLLLMGPGAGTTILNNVALGFANVLPRGPVGIVSAAGTGLQEVSTLLARGGVGISQGIGTGGRDLKKEVGGIMLLEALKALQEDPATEILVLISKPPAEEVVQVILKQVSASRKPTVVCFLGGEMESLAQVPNAIPARTLQECSLLAARALRPETGDIQAFLKAEKARLAKKAKALKGKLDVRQRSLRGLFSGGTLCYEAQVIWKGMLDDAVHSNAPLPGGLALPDSTKSIGHTAVDLGEEEFTVGRPHPMIDNDLRIRRLLQEARDPETAVIILDVVLGYGAHPDPAGELSPAIRQARGLAESAGRELIVVASVTGTEGDPQGLGQTVSTLEEAGAIVCDSNAAAARLTGLIVSGGAS